VFQIATLPAQNLRTDLLAIVLTKKFVRSRKKSYEPFPDYIAKPIREFLQYKDFKGDLKENALFYPHSKTTVKRILFVGSGDESKYSPDQFREFGYLIAEEQEKVRAKRVHLFLGNIEFCKEDLIRVFSEGILFKKYRFEKFKSRAPKKQPYGQFVFSCNKTQYTPQFRRIQVQTQAVMAGVKLARDLANTPSNQLTPAKLKNAALKHFANEANIKTEVHETQWLKKNNFNALMAVAQGSKEEPFLLTLKYTPKGKKVKRLLLVGKGVTFDSGGISIKPALKMEEMKYDMAGAAAVIGSMESVRKLNPKLEIIALIPLVENMPGGGAVKPGDVVTAYNGKTIEIINTDAEGRLILADALAYGVEKYKPDAVIDFATLTGACVVALGDKMAGVFSNSRRLVRGLLEAAEPSGDRLWQLPLHTYYAKELESTVADLKNIGGRWGGAITAAEFLQNFIGKCRWAHIDMAGTAYDISVPDYYGKGATGYGPRLICRALKTLEKIL